MNKVIDIYDSRSCNFFWNCSAEVLLNDWKAGINRQNFDFQTLLKLGHTPMWLRIQNGRLHCVQGTDINFSKLRKKEYRARHYLNRLNRILKTSQISIPEGTEWFTHHSDLVKIQRHTAVFPVFATSGALGYSDIPGIPFMSFSDQIFNAENEIFRTYHNNKIGFDEQWKGKRKEAFFLGALSDCSNARNHHFGLIFYCARAKVVLEAAVGKKALLGGVHTTSKFFRNGDLGLYGFHNCTDCNRRPLNGKDFARELSSYKYLLNFPGAGNWSRRMSTLLQAGSLIFQAESSGYQFYEFGMKPGIHYIPFDPELGRPGAGNLISRIEWAINNEVIAKKIARRASTFGKNCLSEKSIDYYIIILLRRYHSLLVGNVSEQKVIDLSSCYCRSSEKKCKISRVCKGVLERCWN